MALQTFTWNNGTNEHPVELNSAQMSLLLKLSLDTSVQSDVRGHITTSSGRIAKYAKWQLNQKYGENLVIHAEEDDDVFSIIPVRNAINEGESTVITVTGMSASSVKFRLLHSFRNVYGISQAKAQARIHMEGNTLVVNQPEENASWTDEVTIQAIPLYEDWNAIDSNSIVSCTVTVSAKELTGIVLTSPSMVVYGEIFQSEVTLIPSSNTKKNFVTIDAICITDGSIPVRKPTTQGVYIYTQAPSEQCNLTLTVNAYMFNDSETIVFSAQGETESAIPYIRFVVTTDGTFSDISTANPKITLQKIDSEDEPIGEPVVLTGTVSGSSLVYTYSNVASDGSETYKVSIEKISGYRAQFIHKITPNDVSNNVLIIYKYLVSGIYVIYNDDTEEDYDTVYSRNFRPLDNLTPKYIAVITSSYSFIIEPLDTIITMKMCPNTTRVPNIPYTDDDMDGENNTDKIVTFFGTDVEDTDMYAPLMARNSKITIGGNDIRGYIPSYGQLTVLKNNKTNVNSLIENTFNKAKILPGGSTSYSGTTTYSSDSGTQIKCIDGGGTKRGGNQNSSALNIHIFYPY